MAERNQGNQRAGQGSHDEGPGRASAGHALHGAEDTPGPAGAPAIELNRPYAGGSRNASSISTW